ncbi:MAG: hypothetical protein FWE31_01815 [Firmicutes bacterium]|nr:hypothetical protein [Bacillota bacterium]
MFGRRPDGKRIKEKSATARMIPLFMRKRTEATNYFLFNMPCAKFDEFIALRDKTDGISYTYRDLAVATLVRIFAKYPKFNRFLYKDKLYQRNHIDFAMMIHKSLRHGEEEVGIKVRFSGKETLPEIKEKLDSAIKKAITTEDDFGKFMNKMPQFVLRFLTRMLRLFDRWGWLSDKFLFENSPMHSSIFFADLKSIHVNYVFHHLYTFGNCGFFATMGKEQVKPVVDDKTGEIRAEKILELGISMDERFVDGLYYRHMIKGARRIIENLEILETPLEA